MLMDAYPFDLEDNDINQIDVKQLLKYSKYISHPAILVKLIDFMDHRQVHLCYNFLEENQDIHPKEALALLDCSFGDAKV